MYWWGNSWLQGRDDLAEAPDHTPSDAMDGLKTLRPSQGDRPTKESSTRPTSSGKLLQLTPLWEQVVKTQRVPPEVDAGLLFAELGVRLHDPEWQVRQHALRVLVDVVPALRPPADLDRLMRPVVLPELVAGLGHAAPAVRKAALDTLRVYLAHSADPEAVLRAVVVCGLEQPAHPNVPMGVILSVPSLLFPLVAPRNGVIISQQALVHLVSALSKRLVQITFQEQALRTLVRVRDMVGEGRFDRFLEGFHPQCKRDFDILCQVYDVRPGLGDSGIDLQLAAGDDEQGSGYWSDESSPAAPTTSSTPPSEDSISKPDPLELVLGPVEPHESTTAEPAREQEESDSERDSSKKHGSPQPAETPVEKEVSQSGETAVPAGRVILETEIKFSEETAITMTILEENEVRHFYRGDEGHFNDFVMKVLTDEEFYNDDEDVEFPDEPIRRTPRRVRFGGEMVMMRTPDSDIASENQDEPAESVGDAETGDSTAEPQEEETETNNKNFSNSEHLLLNYASENDLEIQQFKASPIPETQIVTYQVQMEESEAQFEASPVLEAPVVVHKEHSEVQQFQAVPVPETQIVKYQEVQQFNAVPVPETQIVTYQVQSEDSEVQQFKAPVVVQREHSQVQQSRAPKRPPPSHIPLPIVPALHRPRPGRYHGAVFKHQITAPTPAPGEPLTCSSSESDQQALVEQLAAAASNWEELGLVGPTVLEALRNKEDWRERMRGVEELTAALQNCETLLQLPGCLPSLFHLLLVTLAEDRCHRVATGALGTVQGLIQTLPGLLLQRHVGQLAAGLARRAAVGGGGGVAVRIEAMQTLRMLMQRLGPMPVLDALLSPPCVSAKSSKVRESALMCVLFAAMTFPSSLLDASTLLARVIPAVGDPRRRVRQAALDAVAVLAQFVPPPAIEAPLKATAEAQGSAGARDGFLGAVRARLARRQLPAISPDGLLMYALQIPAVRGQAPPPNLAGEDVDWILAGSGSLSSGSARSRGQFLTAQRAVSPPPDSRSGLRSSNPWSERRPQELVAVGVGVGAPQQLTWALVPVASFTHDDQRDARSWATDLAASGPSHGTLRPLYLRLQPPPEDRGKLQSEKMNQSWPPPSPAMSPRVLTPSQHRGRRVLEPIGSLNNMHDSGGSTDEPFPRRPTPVQARTGADTPSRHRIPPLQEPSLQVDVDDGGFRTASRPRGIRRRHRVRASSKEQLRLTPPSLLDTSSADCTIPQKPMLARPTMRQELSAALRPDSSGLFTPPAEPFLPPVDVPAPQTAPPLALLDFRSLDEPDERPLLHSHMLSKSLPARALASLEAEERERAYKFRQLKALEYESVSAPERPPPTSSSEQLEYVPAASAPAVLERPEPLVPPTPEVDPQPPAPQPEPEPEQLPALPRTAPAPQVIELTLDTDTTTPLPVPSASTAPLKRTRRVGARPNLAASNSTGGGKLPGRVHRGVLPRTAPQQSGAGMFPDSLRAPERPRELLQQCFQQLDSPEWEVIIQGLQTLMRLLRHHPEVPQAQVHAVMVALGRQVRNLRSQVSRAACQASGELFDALRRAVETDLEDVAGPLFHRSADTNKFLRADCNAALDKMVDAISPARAVAVIVAKGASHQNAIVRTVAARLLVSVVTRLGAERVMLSPRDTRDKILTTGASLLMEGSLDTRSYAKQLFRCLSAHSNFNMILTEVVPPQVLRNISKTLQNLK